MAGRASEAGCGRSRLARAGLLTLVLAAVAALGLLASACGGSSGEGVAQVDSTETTTTGSGSMDGSGSADQADPAAFSACMRSHGVPNFPDPDSEGRIRFRGDPESQQFRAARHACRELETEETPPSPAEQAQERAQMLEFAACMRANGVPKFPDPPPDGGMWIDKKSGVVPNSPQFRAAEKACEDLRGAPEGDPVPQP